MSAVFSYMGTKSWLGTVVNRIVRDLPSGPLLDAFAGMCAVGRSVGTSRALWTNEIQRFPALLAEAQFTFRSGPLPASELLDILHLDFRRNFDALQQRFSAALEGESHYLRSERFSDLVEATSSLPFVGGGPDLDAERLSLAQSPASFPYRLMTINFSGAYFGVRQCFEVDSFRYACDKALKDGKINNEQWSWIILALGTALCRVTNSTGHFAQYLRPTEGNLTRVLRKRRRSVRSELVDALSALSPVGPVEWRQNNRVFCGETISLLRRIAAPGDARPSIIFADPPYSKAQYSRYYHVLETLLLYDYPPAHGVGRYRNDRYNTPFSRLSTVHDALRQLVHGCAKLGATLVLSYPATGLLSSVGWSVETMLREHYRRIRVAYAKQHMHSSFGGPTAAPKRSVREQVFVASHSH